MSTTGTLTYVLYPKTNAQNPDEDPKWYAKTVPSGSVDFDGLVSHMCAHNLPYSRGVISAVLTDMLDCVKELVLDGKTVRLGDLGLFSVSLNTKGALTADRWKVATHLRGVRLKVRNTKTWSNTELRKSCTLTEQKEYTVPEEGTESESTEAEA